MRLDAAKKTVRPLSRLRERVVSAVGLSRESPRGESPLPARGTMLRIARDVPTSPEAGEVAPFLRRDHSVPRGAESATELNSSNPIDAPLWVPHVPRCAYNAIESP
ncbi:hypothetical protein ACVIIV_001062 [Bradyrhizobium sp. USDA 4354]